MNFARKTGLAVALLMTAGASSALAQTTVITREPVQTQTIVTSDPLQLTPVQRQTIYRTVTRTQVQPAQATVQYQVGMRVPQSVELYPMPQEVVTEVPVVQPYKYMVVNDRVWLVNPATSEVVAEVSQ
ncbi:MAG: DUF1236 domain-containing protein [Pseudolabrys sp.]|nr:DUF1236 domain-containing protein [Pseudolabrys sp.]